ncbi:MAG: hypothetical protein K2F65_06585, partial [Eubacterium sp.]|nr:hypothetical protein [Eubacterium sp.]
MDNILSKLNDFRFKDLIKYDNPQQSYGLVENEYFENKKFFGRNDKVTDVCHECDGIKQLNNFQLKIVSHGCHSLDLLEKQKQRGTLDKSKYDYENY